jgi:hypothetical protein
VRPARAWRNGVAARLARRCVQSWQPILAIAVACSVVIASPAHAQRVVLALLVIDDASDAPIPDVRVSVAGQDQDGSTDARGRFVYTTTRSGPISLLLRRLGYVPGALKVDAASGDTVRVTFAMTALPQALATVDVRDTLTSASKSLRGFESRALRHAGSATYVTRSEIEKRRPARMTDLLRRVPSITLADSGGVLFAISTRSRKPVINGATLDLANCPLQVAVDGELKEWGFAVNSLAPEQVHGIEIYPGPSTIPAEYASMRRDANCGLMVIWTRRDK